MPFDATFRLENVPFFVIHSLLDFSDLFLLPRSPNLDELSGFTALDLHPTFDDKDPLIRLPLRLA